MNRLSGVLCAAALLALPGLAVGSTLPRWDAAIAAQNAHSVIAAVFGTRGEAAVLWQNRVAFDSFLFPAPQAIGLRLGTLRTVQRRSQATLGEVPARVAGMAFWNPRAGREHDHSISSAVFGMGALVARLDLQQPPERPAALLWLPSEHRDAVVAGITFGARAALVPALNAGVPFLSQAAPALLDLQPRLALNPGASAAPRSVHLPALAAAPLVSYPTFNPFEDAAAPSSVTVPAASPASLTLAAPMRIGAATVQGHFSAARLQEMKPDAFVSTPAVRQTNDRLAAGTHLDLRPLGRPVAIDVSASYEHLLRNEGTASIYVPNSSNSHASDGEFLTAPAGLNPIAFDPNVVAITRRSLNAAAAVPLSNNLRLNVQYNAQTYAGSASAVAQTIDGRKNSYLGNLTYQIPSTSSAITFSAKQYRFHDNLAPANDSTQNRADLNFTVKF